MSDFDWKEYLTFAKALFKCHESLGVCLPTIHRNAISRAYYAAHNRARQWYGEQQQVTDLPHNQKLIDALYDTGTAGKKMAKYLHDLKLWRGRADYDTSVRSLEMKTHSLLKLAQNVLDLADRN